MIRFMRDGTAEPVSRDKILRRRERGQRNFNFLCSADDKQDWQPDLVDPYSAIRDDHPYIDTKIWYRKYRSLGTPPRLTFQARLLINQEDVNTDRYV